MSESSLSIQHLIPALKELIQLLRKNIRHTAMVHKTNLDSGTLNSAVNRCTEYLRHCPPWGARRERLVALAEALVQRFDMLESIADIELAVTYQRQAVDICPRSNPAHCATAGNLAGILFRRFKKLGNIADLDEAIQCLRKIVDLLQRTKGHRDTANKLNNLGVLLGTRFDQQGDAADINEAVQLHRHALALRPAPHPDRAASLTMLAISLHERFQQEGLGDAADINEAVQLHRHALALRPAPHPDRAASLTGLAISLHKRFHRKGLGDAADINEAVQLHRHALALCPAPHPDRVTSLFGLGSCFVSSYKRTALVDSLSNAIAAFQEAVADSSTPHLIRFLVATRWAAVAHVSHHASALEAYHIGMGLLPFIVAMPNSDSLLVQNSGLRSDAAICAIDSGQYGLAAEFLEAGRIVWSTNLYFRTAVHEELRKRLLDRDRDPNLFSVSSFAKEIIQVAESSRIPFSELRLAASHGPVVVLLAEESTCHALIVEASKTRCIPLPGMTRNVVDVLSQAMQALVTSSSAPITSAFQAILYNREHNLESTYRLLGWNEGTEDHDPQLLFQTILKKLWDMVVAPILAVLEIKRSNNPSRLWWCPTGHFTFLPLHAAGIYGDPFTNESVTDYVISSYTPTLSALLAPPCPKFTTSNPVRITVVIQPQSPGQSSLPNTEKELCKIEEKVPKEWLASLGSSQGPPVSPEIVLHHMKTSSIVHFACHGRGGQSDSALILGSDWLSIKKIMNWSWGMLSMPGDSDRSGMGLAFLSACQTATVHRDMPDEAVHLAGTLLFAGFRSVVATMWTMQDTDGPEVAEAFYGHLFRNANPTATPPIFPDLSESAAALHLAVKKLRTHVPFERWVPFVHYGL